MANSEISAYSLNLLSPNRGARKVKRRIGRGNGSGAGKTSGRGHKGQKARAGQRILPWFEGGQMPLYRRLPDLGFRSSQKRLGINRYCLVSLGILERASKDGVVSDESLRDYGLLPDKWQRAGYKVVAKGTLTKPLTVKVGAVTGGAKAAIEAAGGSVSA